ncbi:MAG: HGxxPAAW family protein [Rhodoluna sp.]|jgi:hypothetical protein
MSSQHDEPGHGNTIAAWTAVITAIIGTSLLTLGYLISNSALMYGGLALAIVSIALGPILSKLGYGLNGKKSKS